MGNVSIRSNVELNGKFIIIKIRGDKERDMDLETIENNIYNGREFGKFSLDIPLIQDNFYLKNEKPQIYKQDGIFQLIYQIEEIKLGIDFQPKYKKI